MEIKTSLKKLIALFARSAGDDELPTASRSFAAKLTILTAHVQRLEAKIDAETAARLPMTQAMKELDKHIADLAAIMMTAQQGAAGASDEVESLDATQDGGGPAPFNAAAAAAAAAQQGDQGSFDGSEDDDEEAQDMAERVLAETAEEERAIKAAAATPPAPVPAPVAIEKVTPLRKNGNKKASNAGDAA